MIKTFPTIIKSGVYNFSQIRNIKMSIDSSSRITVRLFRSFLKKNGSLCRFSSMGRCNDKASKYNCPRCNTPYCSVDCYKSERHAECSESFYRECVTQELASTELDENDKRKMMEILARLHNQNDEGGFDTPEDFMNFMEENYNDLDEESAGPSGDPGLQDSDDEDETPDLAERIGGIDLDDPESLWNALTEDERQGFEAFVKGGDVKTVLPIWKPWWLFKKETKLVELLEDGKEMETEEEYIKDCPPILSNIADFNVLSKAKPADCVRYNLTNVLAAYTYAARFLNGDHCSYEGAACIISICNNLKTGTNFEDGATAVASVSQECINSTFIDSDNENIEAMKEDVKCILDGPERNRQSFYIMCALSDLHATLNEAKMQLKSKDSRTFKDMTAKEFARKFPQHDTSHMPRLELAKVKSYIKKIEYYLSYIKIFPYEM